MVLVIELGLVVVTSVYLYVENGIGRYADKEVQAKILYLVDTTQTLPPVFFETYSKYFPEEATNSLWPSIFSIIVLDKDVPCPCREAAYPLSWMLNERDRISWYVLESFLEKKVGNKKCFEYDMSTAPYGNTRGFGRILEVYYKKDLYELNEREVLELIAIRKAPTRLNPIRNPENLKRYVDAILESYKNRIQE